MSISSRIESIEGHIGDIYDTLELGGSDLTNTDKNIVNINSELMGRYKDYLANGTDSIWNNWDNTTAEGTELTLNNTIQAKMKIKPKGNTEQATRSGKNLLEPKFETKTTNGITINFTNEGMVVSGNSTSQYQYFIIFEKDLPAGTYTINGISGSSFSTYTLGVSKNGTNLAYVMTSPFTFTLTETATIQLFFYPYLTDYSTPKTFQYQLKEGSTATPYEEYGAMPSPDFPSPVNTITGDVEVKVQNGNLGIDTFNSTLHLIGSGQNRTVDGSYSSLVGEIIKVKPNTSYKITGDFSNFGDGVLRLGLFNQYPKVGDISTAYYYGSSITFTTGASDNYILLYNTYNRNTIAPNLFVREVSFGDTYIPHQEQNYTISLGESLPDNFTKVEYIESTGTQYIDTGVVGNQNSKIDIDFAFTGNSGNWAAVFGGRESSSDGKWIAIHQASSNRNIRADWGFIQTFLYTDLLYNDYNKHNFVLEDYKLYIDGEYIGNFGTSTNFSTSTTMAIFCNKLGNNTAEFSKAKVYSLKIYDSSTLIRHFIPCYRNSDNEIGLYDLVNNVFYTNSGTGTFVKGNDLPNGIELCKIGEYQDYIYKENGNWYKHEEIGKYIITGIETIAREDTVLGKTRFRIGDIANVIKNNSSVDISILKCDKLIAGSIENTYNDIQCISYGTSSSSYYKDFTVFINATKDMTVTEFKTWLSTNNLEVYYVLATPTTTQITDTTLINQLNALEQAYSYNEQTNISQDGDLPFILDVTALIELS